MTDTDDLRERLVKRIATAFEGEGPAWWDDSSGDRLASVAADAVLAFADEERDLAWEALARVEALAAEWESWARTQSTTRIDAFRDAAEFLRAALPPAPQQNRSATT